MRAAVVLLFLLFLQQIISGRRASTAGILDFNDLVGKIPAG
jgi:hypothetical protein